MEWMTVGKKVARTAAAMAIGKINVIQLTICKTNGEHIMKEEGKKSNQRLSKLDS